MALSSCTLIKKIALTEDVFELHYELPDEKTMKAGQFMTFILPGIGGRSYSILELHGKIAILVIKRWPVELGGRGGSIKLCDARVWENFSFVGPSGHFTLSTKNCSRCFIGTGTWLVPLYSHILEGLALDTWKKYQLVFGVRHLKDFYYIDRFEALKQQYPDTFFYHLVVSRDPAEGVIRSGYVTDFLTANTFADFEEYYLCGAPAMIEGCQKRLTELGVSWENIFFEKYA